MDDRIAIARLLDPHFGLRCIPRFWKQLVWQTIVPVLEPEELSYYRRWRLGIVECFFEPLAGDPRAGGNPAFSRLADEIRGVTRPADLYARLGLPPTPPDRGLDWLVCAAEREDDPVVAAYCLASAWATPTPSGGVWADRDDYAIRTVLKIVPELAGERHFSGRFEAWFGLEDGHYVNSGAARARLFAGDGPLSFVESPNTRLKLVQHLHMSLLQLENRRHGAAVVMLEGWLGLDHEDYRDASLVGDRLSSPDCPLGQSGARDAETFLIAALAESLRVVEKRGPRAALALLEGFLGVVPESFSNAESVRRRIQAADCPLMSLSLEPGGVWARSAIIAALAFSLAHSAGRGPREVVTLFEGVFGIGQDDYTEADRLWSRIYATEGFALPGERWIPGVANQAHGSPAVGRCDASPTEVTSQRPGGRPRPSSPQRMIDATWLAPFAAALYQVTIRGPDKTVSLLESWLGLRPEDYNEPAAVRRRLRSEDDRPRVGINESLLATLVLCLAHALILGKGRGPGATRTLIEGWLGLRPEDYADAHSIALRLRAHDSPLVHLADEPGLTATNLLVALARALVAEGGASAGRAVALLEGWLGLRPRDYANPNSIRRRLRVPDCPLSDTGAWMTSASTLSLLATALHDAGGGGPRQAYVLLEGWLEGSFASIVDNSRLSGTSASNRIILAMAWLNTAGPGGTSDGEVEAACEAVVRYVATIREGLDSFGKRQDFLTQAGRLLATLRRIALRRADRLRNGGDQAGAERVELRLLHWIEQFRNRILIEEMINRADRLAGDGASLAGTVTQQAWPLRHVSISDLFRPANAEGLSLDPRPDDAFDGPAIPLAALDRHQLSDAPHDPARVFADDFRGIPDPAVLTRRDELARIVARQSWIEGMLPDRAVWVSFVFEDDGALRWWAVRRVGDSVRILNRGRSDDGARQRIAAATLEFDFAVIAAWRAHDGGRLPPVAVGWLGALNQYLRRPEGLREWLPPATADPAEGPRSFDELIQTSPTFAKFWNRGAELKSNDRLRLEWPGLVESAIRILNHLAMIVLGTPNELPGWVMEAWGDLFQDWGQPTDIDGRVELGLRLRRRLDEASERYLDAVARELDLGSLFGSAPGVDWLETDILLQPEGPLLSAPLPWLPFGPRREPLFRQVASTSTVVSLAMRAVGEEEASRAAAPGRAVLSCQWLDAADWARMRGLAWLHARLVRLFGSRNVWGIGDDPEARTDVFLAMLRHQPFSIAVVGGHGDPVEAGVKLKDEKCWCGEGADLSTVDLLIFVACAVGRVNQDGDRDVEGLYSRLLVHRGRSVIAARWKIADFEAARFIAEVLDQLRVMQERGAPPPFARARALNRARCKLVGPVDDRSKVSFHLASAFDLYGRG